MGNEFTRRMNRDGTGVEPAKFGLQFQYLNMSHRSKYSATQERNY